MFTTYSSIIKLRCIIVKKILMLLFPIVCALLIIGCTNSGANENDKKYYYDENVHYKVDKNGEYIDPMTLNKLFFA